METSSLLFGILLLIVSWYLWMNISFQHSPFQRIHALPAEQFNEGVLIATSLISGFGSGLIFYLWITEKAPSCGDPTGILMFLYLSFYALLVIIKISFFRKRIISN